MNEPLRGATIGAGKMGLAHGTILNSLPNSELVSICEPTKLIQNTFKEFAPHISIYDDHIKMLDAQANMLKQSLENAIDSIDLASSED